MINDGNHLIITQSGQDSLKLINSEVANVLSMATMQWSPPLSFTNMEEPQIYSSFDLSVAYQ